MNLRDSLTYEPHELAFGTSGLRGLISDMTDLECYINVTGFLQFLTITQGLAPGSKIYIAGDLRDSTPRIMRVVAQAIRDTGYQVENYGLIPTPALAFYALRNNVACIMVTGSHIPADRNGIKFYKQQGEVLKADEKPMQMHVAATRSLLYEQAATDSAFNTDGRLREPAELPEASNNARVAYLARYTDIFAPDSFAGKKIVVYQHSAVGRDLLVELFEQLGAMVVPVERSEVFIPIDTEHVRPQDKALFARLAAEHPDALAIISTDGDSDRPFVIDETGEFHRGDVLGAIVAGYVGAKFVALPVSSNDAVDAFCINRAITAVHTKIGSPYVIVAMNEAGADQRPAVGWEVNGGFLTNDDIVLSGGTLQALPTRDAVLPILASLLSAVQSGQTVSALFAELPQRFTGGSLIDNVPEVQIARFKQLATDETAMRLLADKVFGPSDLGDVAQLNITDGLRLIFKSGDVIHLRPSGNAPQFRVYSNANTQVRADELADNAVAQNGYIEQLLAQIEA